MLPWSDWVVPSALGTKVKPHHFTSRSTTRTMLSENTARMGDKAKPSGVGAPVALLFVRPWCVSRPTGPLKPSIAFRSDRWLDCKLPRCQFDNARVPPKRHLRGTKAKPSVAYRRRLCCLGRQPALIPVVPAVPIMMVVMIRVIGVVMTVMVGVVPAVPRCSWNRAADYDCANNAQRCSNCRQGSHDAFLHLVFSSFG